MTTHSSCGAQHGAAASDTFALAGAPPSYAPDLALEPVHIEVVLAFDVGAASATGSVATRVRARNAHGRARTLVLDAVDFEDVRVETDDPASTWRYDAKQVHVTWSRAFERGEERSVRVHYTLRQPKGGMLFSRPDAAYPERPLFVATDNETERARYWLPCIDYPNVRTSFDFHLTAPAELTILAGGLLHEERRHANGTKTAHWQLEHPCPSYLACLCIGEFVVADGGEHGGREITYWGARPTTPADLRRSFGRTPDMMRWMEQRLGLPFPFPKYHQIAVPAIGGAMENISLVTWDDMAVLDERLEPERVEVIDAINLHEMAHAYFGDSVVIRHFEHAWLKESWAVYMETVWWEETAGAERRDWDLDVNAEQYFEEVAKRYARPIVTRTYDSSWSLFDRHTYPGGAWRIHMLRARVGDEAFWRATKSYLERHAQSTAESDDFRRALEDASGLNLTRFFDEWILSPGYPRLEVQCKQDAERLRATLSVKQAQVDAARGIGLFSFALSVRWRDADGTHASELEISDERHEFVLPYRGKLELVEIDPESRVLCGLEFDPGADLCAAALSSAALRVRLWAVRALAKSGSARALEDLAAALGPESFFGLRIAAARALGASHDASAAPMLARLLLGERDPRAKAAIAEAAGGFRDERLRAALREFLGRDEPDRARAAAFQSLGRQRHPDDFERLLEGSRLHSRHEFVRAGALRGLGQLGTAAAHAELAGRCAYGAEPDDSRPAAVEALAQAAKRLDRGLREAARDQLADLTRDAQAAVRMAAARALGQLGLGGCEDALEALKHLQPAQDVPAIERILRDLRRGPGDEVQKLRSDLERWQERYQRLAERVGALEAKGAVAP